MPGLPDATLVLHGRIDEHAELAARAASLPDGPIDIDLDGVTYINSLGVRDWILLLRRLAARGNPVTLHRCSEPMIQQMNMILDARGAAQVASLHVPFYCEGCGWEGPQVVAAVEVAARLDAGELPRAPCPDCESTLRFADHDDRYFLFLG